LPFCDLCGRELAPTARFCDLCGKSLVRPPRLCDNCGRLLSGDARFCDMCGTQVEAEGMRPAELPLVVTGPSRPRVVVLRPTQAMATTYEPTAPITLPRMVTEPQPEAVTRLEPEAVTKPEPARHPPPTTAAAPRGRAVRFRRFHMTRRRLALSAVGVMAIAIVAFSLLGGAVTVPDLFSHLPGLPGQTTGTATTQVSRQALTVEITLSANSISLGGIQTVTLLVLDQDRQPVSDASVHLDIIPLQTAPSGSTYSFDGLTDPQGQYVRTWQIRALPDNIGTFQVTASATKPGYEDGQAKTTFEVTA